MSDHRIGGPALEFHGANALQHVNVVQAEAYVIYTQQLCRRSMPARCIAMLHAAVCARMRPQPVYGNADCTTASIAVQTCAMAMQHCN